MKWFEQEIEKAHDQGVTNPGNLPYFLNATTPNKQAILLIHGFGSSPWEMRPLANHLHQQNFTVYGARLPGHGTNPEDLRDRTANEWLTTISSNYQSLINKGYKVSVAGLSTGAVLALKLALTQQPEKLILLAPFLQLKHPLAPISGLLSYIAPYQNKNIPLTEQPYYYQKRPLKGVAQIIKLCKQLDGNLDKITTPSITLTSSGDATIAAGTAANIYRQLGGNSKRFHCYSTAVPHVLTAAYNPCQKDVFLRCSNFMLGI